MEPARMLGELIRTVMLVLIAAAVMWSACLNTASYRPDPGTTKNR